MAHLSRSKASLRLFGDDLAPEEITRMLGHPASSSCKKGQVVGVIKATGKDRLAKTGRWSLEATDASPENLDGQIEEIFAKLTGDLAVWKALSGRYSIDLFCGLFMKNENDGFSLSPESMKTLGLRGVEIGFDIYGALPEEEINA